MSRRIAGLAVLGFLLVCLAAFTGVARADGGGEHHKGDRQAKDEQHQRDAAKKQDEQKSSDQQVTFCDMESSTSGKLETKSAAKVVSHELNGTPEEARDIVPSFTFNGQTYSQLWDANGQAIFNNGCQAPAQAQ